MTEKSRKSLKPVGSTPGVIYGLCKVHKTSVENRPLFWPILSTLNSRSYKLVKFLVPISKPLITNEITVTDFFDFPEGIIIRSSCPKVFLGKGVLKICSRLTGEHLCQSVIPITIFCNFIEIKLRHGFSPESSLHTFRTPFLKNTPWGLLLY